MNKAHHEEGKVTELQERDVPKINEILRIHIEPVLEECRPLKRIIQQIIHEYMHKF